MNQIGSERTHITVAFTLRLDDDTLKALDRFAERTDPEADSPPERWKSLWRSTPGKLRKIKAGINAADRGDFAGDREVARVLGKYSAED